MKNQGFEPNLFKFLCHVFDPYPMPTHVPWLSALQQRFVEGLDCDVIVRVKIEQPPAKRTRTDDGTDAGDGAVQPMQEQQRQRLTVDIPCNSSILKVRSAYFDAAFSGAHVKNEQRKVNIELPDVQAVEDFRLLVKLACGVSYVHDGGVRLSMSKRLRLAFLGNTFEFKECVKECLQSLSEDALVPEDACTLLDKMPKELWEHEAAMAIRIKIAKVLVEEVDKQAKRREEGGTVAKETAAAADLMCKVTKALVGIIDELGPRAVHGEASTRSKYEILEQVGGALCMVLGPVDQMFDQGPASKQFKHTLYISLPLCVDIKRLSARVMSILLGSDKLQLRSENDAYYLLCAWLSQSRRISDQKECRVLFSRFLPQLRFEHMSQDFLSAFVSACPYANASGLFSYILRYSHARLTLPRNLHDSHKKLVKMGKKDRSMGDLPCTLKSKLGLQDLLPLKLKKAPEVPERISKYIGLALGFPVAVQVNREAKGLFGIYVYVGMPLWQGLSVDEGRESRVAFECWVETGKKTNYLGYLFNGKGSRGWPDFFGKPWEDVVFPDSPYFPDGVMTMEVTMKPIKRN